MAIRDLGKGRFQAYFDFQGKRHTKVFSTKRECTTWEVKEKERLKLSTLTLMYSVACARYLADCRSRVEAITFKEKVRYLRELACYAGQDFPVQSMTVSFARQFLAHVQEKRGKKAANRRLGELKTCWKSMLEEVPTNPWAKIPPYGEEAYKKYVPPVEDVAKVLMKATPREKSLLMFLISTGARVGEAYNLTWDDVDFKTKSLLLWTRKRRHSDRESRAIPMTDHLLALLTDLRQNGAPGDGHVFINPNTGRPYERLQPAVRYMMRRLCKAAGVKRFGFHALRHYVARMLIAGGKANLGDIQVLYGHQNATTTDIYLKSLSASPVSHVAPYITDDVINKTMAAMEAVS